MQSLFPGLWLSEITPDLYKIDIEVILPIHLLSVWLKLRLNDLFFPVVFFFAEDLDCYEVKLFEELRDASCPM